MIKAGEAIHIAAFTGVKVISGWRFFMIFHYNSAAADDIENVLQTQQF